jgi:NAD(P)-dependent dehydrogenase (short-subunit alcohol dehydrogenase family)
MNEMGTIAISGCATGIGAASRRALEGEGHTVIGIDLKAAEVIGDLGSRKGREGAIEQTLERCNGKLDRLLLCAGLGGHIADKTLVASVNYFGAVELLDAFLPALTKGESPAALAVCSNSAQLSPTLGDSSLAQAMLAGDEDEARRLAAGESGQMVYMISKNAMGQAIRRRTLQWGEAGVRLNGIAPGPIDTPLLQAGLATPGDGDMIRGFKVPLGRFGQPEEMAGIITFLLGENAGFVHGAIWYADGGADANVRPERF